MDAYNRNLFRSHLDMSVKRTTKPLSAASQLRRVVFTLNNYTELEFQNLKSLPNIKAIIIGKEVGATGTKHLQGAVCFDKPVRFSTLKRLSPRAHWERMAGTPAQAFEYCRKDSDYWEFGDLPSQGKRSDLLDAVEKIQSGQPISSVVETVEGASVYVKYHKGLKSLAQLVNNSQPLRPKRIVWLHGPTGVGKTRTAVEFCQSLGVPYWISGRDLQWFDGYIGQPVAIIDDFRWKHIGFSFFLRILDRYEVQVPIKGDFVRWNPAVIFITTPKTIDGTFDHEFRDPEDLKQVHRRVNYNVQLTGSNSSCGIGVLDTVLRQHVEETYFQKSPSPPAEGHPPSPVPSPTSSQDCNDTNIM
jgi:hypothetical protein